VKDAAGSLLDHLMDINNAPEPRMRRVENLVRELADWIVFQCSMPSKNILPCRAIRRELYEEDFNNLNSSTGVAR
jgi:hypothetical protein